MAGLNQDVRYVVRTLRRSPAFTLVVVVSLAIATGANTSLFGVVRTLLLTPLAVERPEELRLLTWSREGNVPINNTGSTSYRDPETGASLQSNFTYPIFRALGGDAPPDVPVFAFAFLRGVSVAVGGDPAFLAGGALVDGHYFSGLKAPVALGRPIGPEDDIPGARVVAVLSHAFWMRAFGGDPSVINRTVRVNGVAAEIVGVTARGFQGLSMGGFFPQTEITLPLAAQPQVYRRLSNEASLFTSDDNFWLRLMARVSAGTSVALVQERLAATLRAGPSPLVGSDGHLPVLRLIDGSHGAEPVRPAMARLLYLLLGVVGIVLVIACVNLAGLMLARGVGRQREMAVRAALGGGRARLVRQTLIEALVLSAAGAAGGLVLTVIGRDALRGLLVGSLGPGAGDLDIRVSLDPTLFALAVTLAVVAALASGLLPALRLSGADPIAWLTHRGTRGSAPHLKTGRALVAVQIAVSVPLVVGAVLFLRTLANLAAVELGFDPKGIASFQVDPFYTHLPEESHPRLYQELLARVQQVPGVRSATLVENAPLSGIVSNSTVDVDGKRVALYRNGIGPSFLETMGARLVEGRMPGLQDGPGAPRVGVVNQAAVRQIFGGRSPVGRLLRARGRDEVQVVGVVNDMPYRNARDPVPATLYESALQRSAWGGYHVFVRTDVAVARLEKPLREAVAQVDPDIPVPRIREQTEIIAQAGAKERAFAQLLTVFGAFALFIAAIGLHGMTSYAVTRRTSEIGVRMAVGAAPGRILWMVLRQVVVLSGIGLVVGVPAALAAAPLVGSLLYGVAPGSPGTIAAAALVMVAVAVGAGLVPALRAAGLDPVEALRRE
jgi:predicted permease